MGSACTVTMSSAKACSGIGFKLRSLYRLLLYRVAGFRNPNDEKQFG